MGKVIKKNTWRRFTILNTQNVKRAIAATRVKRGSRGLPSAASLMAALATTLAQTPSLAQGMPSAFQNAAPDGQSPPPGASQFLGAWRNDNPNTGGLTRLEVQDRASDSRYTPGRLFAVRMRLGHRGGSGNSRNRQQYVGTGRRAAPDDACPGPDRLRMTLDRVYKGHRAPRHDVEDFVRSK